MQAGRPLAPELGRVLQAAIATLQHGERVVLVLRHVERLSEAEIHTALGITEQQQRQLLHQARSRMRNALERHFDRQQEECVP